MIAKLLSLIGKYQRRDTPCEFNSDFLPSKVIVMASRFRTSVFFESEQKNPAKRFFAVGFSIGWFPLISGFRRRHGSLFLGGNFTNKQGE